MTKSSGDPGGQARRHDVRVRRAWTVATPRRRGQDAGLRVRRHDRPAIEPSAGARAGRAQDFDYDSTEELVGRAAGQDGAETQGSYKDVRDGCQWLGRGPGGQRRQDQARQPVPYDPYGKIENEAQLPDRPGKDNPFRFESFYYDSGVKQYDMRARNYRPEIGRFTSQDRFESASKDFNLQADPLTQNRYAFAGGNPVNRVEFDGHLSLDDVEDAAKDFGEGAKESVEDTVEAVKDPNGDGGGLARAWASRLPRTRSARRRRPRGGRRVLQENAAKCAGKAAWLWPAARASARRQGVPARRPRARRQARPVRGGQGSGQTARAASRRTATRSCPARRC